MSRLMKSQNIVQKVAEAIAAVLNVEVTIIDEKRTRVAASSEYKNLINKPLPEHSAFEYILKEKEPKIVKTAKHDELCSKCSKRSSCKELCTIGYPIILKQEMIGVIGIIAFDSKQKEKLINKEEALIVFLDRISSLITSHIIAVENNERIKIQSQELKEIADNCDDGIVCTNSDGIVKYVNKEALKMLQISENEIMNYKIKKFFENIKIEIKELQKTYYNNKTYLVNVKPVAINGREKSRILIIKELEREVEEAYKLIQKETLLNFDHIIGEHEKIKKIKNMCQKVANSDSTIMLRGETGTGKELFARAIHFYSLRRNKPFIAINCASIPEHLLESELFGYEGGAFTGANKKGKIGKLELANNGTIFLDEIGDLPLHLQPKILRVLQEGEFTRIGGNKTIQVNLRVICATHKNLEKMIESREFREDLYYRLNVIPIFIPPLREREDDIILLSSFFINKYCKILGKPIKRLSKEVEGIFLKYNWPGNVRELENTIEFCVNISDKEIITKEDLPQRFIKNIENHMQYSNLSHSTLDKLVSDYEKKILRDYLMKYGNSTEAKKIIAQKLNVALATLYRKIKKYNLD